METALSTLSVLPATREQQHRFANMMVEEIINGDHDPVKVWHQMSIIADTLNEVKDSLTVRQAVANELEKYGKEGASINGCKITLTGRKKWDYSECGHTGYNTMKAQEEKVKSAIKDIEKFLQAMKEPMVDPTSGEIIIPPTFTTTEVITVK